jgi:hypothetical protein
MPVHLLKSAPLIVFPRATRLSVSREIMPEMTKNGAAPKDRSAAVDTKMRD